MFGKGLLVGFGFVFEILLSGCGREARRLCRPEPRLALKWVLVKLKNRSKLEVLTKVAL